MPKSKVLWFRCLIIAGLTLLVNGPYEKAQSPHQSPQEVRSENRTQSLPADSSEGKVVALEGTAPLARSISGDIREEQRQQIIRYFLQQIASTPAKRESLWQPDFSSAAAYQASVQKHRDHLRRMLGLVQATPGNPTTQVLYESANLRIEDVILPIDAELQVRALLFLPRSSTPTPAVIAISTESTTREEFTGIVQGMTPAPWLTTLLGRKVAVAVPMMTERRDDHQICRQAGNRDRRRVLWRAGFIVGRTLVGLEVQQALALREFLASQPGILAPEIAIMGEAQGGMTALYAGAVDERFAAVASLNYFEQRENCWQEPVDRVLYGQLNEFGDAEVAALVAPRPLWIVTEPGHSVSFASVSAELARARRFFGGLGDADKLTSVEASENALVVAADGIAAALGATAKETTSEFAFRIPLAQIAQVRDQQFETLFQYLQNLDAASDQVRNTYWQLNSTPPGDRPQKVQKLRTELASLVGVTATDPVPLHPRTALIGETDKFVAYDVLLDVAEGVEAYGQLLVPRAVAGHVGHRLPAVVCQHGFDGSPKYVSGVGSGIDSADHFYHRFGERLAERGYVVFAPYLTVPEDHRQPMFTYRADFVNPLVRLAASLGLMRTSIELAKLHHIVDFLQSLPFVEPNNIGYYGLSYGGYSALWMPPLEPRLKLTIISAHFNDWRTMLTDPTRFNASYWTLPDEDFYNWNVLNRFVHTEIIAAMWPRPVSIEYGSDDQVTTPEWHQRAWRELRQFSEAWGMEEKIVDDDFSGPHSIHGIGTFFFLDRWLRPDRPAGRDYGCRDDDYCNEIVAPDGHGYVQPAGESVPYATQLLDSNPRSMIRGRFYVADTATVFTGMSFKIARNGNPGDLVVRFGSSEGSGDLGEGRILSKDVYPQYDFWYEARLRKALRLDPARSYFFEIKAASGEAPKDCYTIFGPKPLGGEDYPANFGLSFRTLASTSKGE